MLKNPITWILCLMALISLPHAVAAEPKEMIFQGTWLTINRQLDGEMTSVVTDLGGNKWRGHFYGTWQGVDFSYRVNFTGPPEKLVGTAVIDGADYQWSGELSRDANGFFKGEFDGSRYRGSFKLKRKVSVPTEK